VRKNVHAVDFLAKADCAQGGERWERLLGTYLDGCMTWFHQFESSKSRWGEEQRDGRWKGDNCGMQVSLNSRCLCVVLYSSNVSDASLLSLLLLVDDVGWSSNC
jgi:hypothetical protein